MPYEISMFQLPCGSRAAKVDCHGIVTGEEAAELVRQHSPGGPLHGVPTLVLTARMVRESPEARSAFAGRKVTEWTAMVMTNPLLRVTTSFIIRVSGSPLLRVFANEQDAVRWLDERAREDAAKAT
jgi:hypothetical protein